ncbi:MAG: lnt [Verrucomicrobiales bacterium]|nr:lnt [Verrucomicrobiales bacterium]
MWGRPECILWKNTDVLRLSALSVTRRIVPLMFFTKKFWAIAMLCLATAGLRAWGHQANDSWLSFTVTNGAVTGQWDLNVQDLDTALGLDDNDDATISDDELQAHNNAILAFVLPHLHVITDGVEKQVRVTGHKLETHLNGVYVGLLFNLDNLASVPKNVQVTCDLFYDLNPKFLNRLSLDANGQQRTINLTSDAPTQTFELAQTNLTKQFFGFVREGVWHIWSGFDHILFLIALLLPSVLWRRENQWQPVGEFRRALINVLKVVTAFTVAHSITLSLATLGVVQLPSRLTESAIAASVVIAAANNIFPIFTRREWMVAFGFGLIHGFGFASGLSDMGVTRENLAVTVLGFNLGVEAGQLAIVSAFLPIAYALRSSWLYPRIVLAGGSCAIVLVAAVWLVERAFNLKLMPF